MRIIPRRKVSNLQSSMNTPNSPYLADNLREYSAQLIAKHVTEVIDPRKLANA